MTMFALWVFMSLVTPASLQSSSTSSTNGVPFKVCEESLSWQYALKALEAHSLCRAQEKCRMREMEVQIGNSAQLPQKEYDVTSLSRMQTELDTIGRRA